MPRKRAEKIAEQASAVVALLDAPAPSTEAERLALHAELVAGGLSDYEARGTAWPEPEPVEAAMEPVGAGLPDSLPDDEPSEAEIAAMSVAVEEPPVSMTTCPECGGCGEVPVSRLAFETPSSGPHALDAAPLNSKIVVVLLDGKSHAVLAGPDGAKELAKGDPAHRLPEGARIRKVGPKEFLAEQMSPAEDHEPFVTETAGAAIAGFIAHFHPHGLS